MAQQKRSGKPKERFPWLVLLLLGGTIYLFWVVPYQQGPRPIKVEFAGTSR